MAEHRVPMLGAALRRRRDPANSRDPNVRRVVAALSDLGVAPAPRAEFRDELRAQLVAVAPRLVAEGRAELRKAGAADGRAASRAPGSTDETADPGARRKLHLKRPLLAVTGVLAAFILLLGGAVVLSRHALPGDALYGLKRASENTEYSLAGGSIDRGKLKLQFAATRIGEVEQLLGTPAALGPGVGALADSGAINSSTATLARQTLGSANSDILTASQLLTGSAVATHKDGALSVISGWTPNQARALNRIIARVHGTGLARPARHTATLINRMASRAAQLKAELHCSCLDPARSDQFGPKPCRGACSAPAHRRGSTGPKPGGGGSGGSSGGTGSGGKSGATPRSSGAPQPGPSAGSSAPRHGRRSSGPRGGSSGATSGPAQPNSSSGSNPRLPPPSSALPSLPSAPVSSAPLPAAGSSCATLTLGPIHVGIGNC